MVIREIFDADIHSLKNGVDKKITLVLEQLQEG